MDRDFLAMERAYVKRLDSHDKKASKLQEEQDREELEKRRSGMPGAIRRTDALGVWWTHRRYDVADNNLALFQSPELD